jgi:hypothetical protein
MSTSDSKDTPSEAAEGSHEIGNMSEPKDSIWKTGLQPGQIRLFSMELDEGDSISGTLGTFEHKSAPKYIAQSYVCGEGEYDFRITVNGNAHYIQPNLSIALRQTKRALRSLGSGEESNLLWIDAICIDQSSVAEREAQIRFMEHIYRGAAATLISLGEWTKSQRLLAGFFKWAEENARIFLLQEEKDLHSTDRDGARILDAARTQRHSLEWPSVLQAEFDMSGEDARTISEALMDPPTERLDNRALHYTHPFWQACMELFESEWFSRLWTFQELWLSRSPYVTLQALVPWDTLSLMLESDCIHNLSTAYDDRSTLVSSGHLESFANQSMSLHYHTRAGITDDCWTLLAITATKRAKLPKDHVFAILGLMDADTQRLIDVGYSKTDAQVFQDTLQFAMRSNAAARRLPNHWEIFALVPTTTPGLPSWVPDLNNKKNASIPYSFRLVFSKAASYAFDDAAQLRVSPENGLIFLTVLEVAVVSIPGGEPFRAHDWSRQTLTEVLVWIKGLYNKMTSCEDDLPALKGRLRDFFASIAELCQEEIAALSFLMEASQLLGDLEFDEVVLREEQSIESLYLLTRRLWARITSLGSIYFFTTSCGRVGCSPKSVSPSDRICIVPGGKHLHVFSSTPSRYITCASVHGLMGDDLPDIVRELGREFEEIAIH